ncbi:unnamed protein product [Ranitomeya imitator]|uniref:Uncharacterized protein n=1 Tax=Ranitomeya imitator TaxID=111125 RepID=A0ABN9LDC8_9NEOB|nr:unnamed protein product [Ranitomeya imitator]
MLPSFWKMAAPMEKTDGPREARMFKDRKGLFTFRYFCPIDVHWYRVSVSARSDIFGISVDPIRYRYFWVSEGNILQLNMKELHMSLKKLGKVYGDIFTVHLGPKPVVVLHGYDVMKEALVDRADVFSNRAKVPSANFLFKGYGVMLSNGERWKQLRRFSLTTMRNFGMGKRSVEERIQEESRCLSDEFKKLKGSSFDPTYLLTLAVANVICSIVFGERFEYEDEKFLSLLAMLKESFKILNSSTGQLCYSLLLEALRRKGCTALPLVRHEQYSKLKVQNEILQSKVEC